FLPRAGAARGDEHAHDHRHRCSYRPHPNVYTAPRGRRVTGEATLAWVSVLEARLRARPVVRYSALLCSTASSTRKNRPLPPIQMPTLPLSYSATSGSALVETMRTRATSSLSFLIWCPPSAPRGKPTTSPSLSSRSPSCRRTVGAPRNTTSSSSLAWWK